MDQASTPANMSDGKERVAEIRTEFNRVEEEITVLEHRLGELLKQEQEAVRQSTTSYEQICAMSAAELAELNQRSIEYWEKVL